VTAATLPSLEDVVLGNLPGLPKVHLYNKVLAYENGDEYIQTFHQAANGELDAPFVLVIEGSIPNENISGDGFWTSFGFDPATGQPLTLNWWIDQLAPKAWAVVGAGTCATYGGIHAMAGNPTGAMGLADYLGWDFRSVAGIPIVNVPGCPVQPDNFMETVAWLLYQAAGLSPMIPLDDQLRPTWLFGKTVHEGCDRAGYYEQGDFALDYNSPKCIVKLGCCRQLQRHQAWLDGRAWRLSQRRRHLHRLHYAGLPRQVHALHGRAARRQGLLHADQGLRGHDPQAPRPNQHDGQQGAKVAPQPRGAHHRLQPALARVKKGYRSST
jgi:hypothetical protein